MPFKDEVQSSITTLNEGGSIKSSADYKVYLAENGQTLTQKKTNANAPVKKTSVSIEKVNTIFLEIYVHLPFQSTEIQKTTLWFAKTRMLYMFAAVICFEKTGVFIIGDEQWVLLRRNAGRRLRSINAESS